MSTDMPAALVTLLADGAAEAEELEQNRELITRLVFVLFAAGAVFVASGIAVLIQLQ
jgi:hypothetical protein